MTIAKRETSGAAEPQRSRGRPQLRSDEETRALIMEAARSEFAASGYATTGMESVARRAGISTKTLYRLIPNKAALFEAMVTDRIDRFASVVKLRGCQGRDIETALTEALIVYGELILDGEVIALQRTIIAENDKFPEVAETFFHKAIRRTEETLAELAARTTGARPHSDRRCRGHRRHAARHARVPAAARGDVRPYAAAEPAGDRAPRKAMRDAVPGRMPPLTRP